ncbi:alpha/beta hydrolase [Spirillospora sp. NPDC029432]|uniref:alpha/beta hydrolase n=1 Tax=Spirillospora sp. NPDC029432 TaxID=3154599 RepID=UPI003454A8AD
MRRRTRNRGIAASLTLAALAATAAPMTHREPYAAPAAAPGLTSASALTGLYAAVERDIRKARSTALAAGDTGRAGTMTRFLAPGRRFLAFDPRGSGRAVEVNGDLARAGRIAVVVPGADGLLTNFESEKWAGGGARTLHRRAAAVAPGARLATVGWLGYDSPSTRSAAVVTDGRADDAARALARFVTGLRRVNPGAEVALLCHSYGSVVCAKAAPRLARSQVDEVALYGSPGVDARSAAAFRSTARLWTGRAGGDWTRFVPKFRLFGLGFGADPVAVGAARFDAGGGTHSSYLVPGSPALRNLTMIALGRDSEVTHARNA